MKDHHPKNVTAKKAIRKPRKRGRPALYSPELSTRLLEKMLELRSLRKACELDAMPCMTTVLKWLCDPDLSNFTLQYSRTREAMADAFADEIIHIADAAQPGSKIKRKFDKNGKPIREVETGDNVERSKLRVHARQWAASKIHPKKYGDRVVHQGDDDADPINTSFTLDIGDKTIKED